MILFLTEIFTTTTKICNMRNNDIHLIKFTLNTIIIIFITWTIETNLNLERLYVMPFVVVVYLLLLLSLKSIKKD